MICEGKQRFESWNDADKAARRTRERGYGHGMQAYKCGLCGFHHVGHKANRKKKLKLKVRRK